jgi:hypothetical protein
MATEEFKELCESLFDNYVELMIKKTEGFNVKLSFKEYLEFYIEYKKVEDNQEYFPEEEEYDEEDEELDSEDDTE